MNEEFGVKFDIEDMLEEDMRNIDIFMLPNAHVPLGYEEGYLAGIACLKNLAPRISEIKRISVRSANRQRCLGRMLINQLVSKATQNGYERLCLDNAGFMKEAHPLYRTIGFTELKAYEGSEIPKEFQKYCIFVEMELVGNKSEDSGLYA